jgi:hypothetical protein
MKDFTEQAEQLFRDFAQRHSLIINKVDEPNVELLMRVPKQAGLKFQLTLGLQNIDELNIGINDFWSHFFPYEACKQTVSTALDGLVDGDCRLAIHRQLGRVTRRILEQRRGDEWKTIYTQFVGVRIPFLGSSICYLSNRDMQDC